MKKLTLVALILSVIALGASATPTYAFSWNWKALRAEISADKQDVRGDRQDLRKDQHDTNLDRRLEVAGRRVNRLKHLYDLLVKWEGKLQARVDNAKNAGKDVSAIQPNLDDMSAKLADAKTQYDAVVTLVDSLKTSTDKTSVVASIKNDFKTILADLKAAKKDGKEVRSQIKSLGY